MTRRAALAAGILVLLAAWFSPLAGLAESPFVRHMIVHVAVIAVAAPLIGAWLVVALRRAGAVVEPFLAPLPASLFEFAVVWTWHMPLLHGLARISEGVWLLEQVSFLAAGVLLWTSALRLASGAGVLALLMTSMHMVLLGTLLTLSPRPLYAHGIQTLGDLYAHLAGQRLGGMLMLLGGGIPYLAGGLYLVDRMLRGPGEEALEDGEAVRGTPDERAGANVPSVDFVPVARSGGLQRELQRRLGRRPPWRGRHPG